MSTDPGDAMFEYGVDDREDDEVIDLELSLGEGAEDLMAAEGYSPLDDPLGVDELGTTVDEQREGELLDERELRMVPDVTSLDPGSDTDTSLARQLSAVGDEDGVVDTEKDLLASEAPGTLPGPTGLGAADMGQAGLSAEEAAMHRIDGDVDAGEDEDLALDEGSTN